MTFIQLHLDYDDIVKQIIIHLKMSLSHMHSPFELTIGCTCNQFFLHNAFIFHVHDLYALNLLSVKVDRSLYQVRNYEKLR